MPDREGIRKLSAATLSVWGGEEDPLVQGATQVPVVYSAAYEYPDVDTHLQKPYYEVGTNVRMEITVEHHRQHAPARVAKLPFYEPERKKK